MHILRPDQFSEDTLTYHIELEEELYPYINQSLNPEYFKAVVHKARELFDALFHEGEAFFLVYHVYGEPKGATGLFRYIRDRSVRYNLTATRSLIEEEVLWTYMIPIVGRNQLHVHRLLEAICYQDFPPLKPRLKNRNTSYPAVQFIHQQNGHVLYIYDDRGAYIRAMSDDQLQSLKQKVPPPDMS